MSHLDTALSYTKGRSTRKIESPLRKLSSRFVQLHKPLPNHTAFDTVFVAVSNHLWSLRGLFASAKSPENWLSRLPSFTMFRTFFVSQPFEIDLYVRKGASIGWGCEIRDSCGINHPWLMLHHETPGELTERNPNFSYSSRICMHQTPITLVLRHISCALLEGVPTLRRIQCVFSAAHIWQASATRTTREKYQPWRLFISWLSKWNLVCIQPCDIYTNRYAAKFSVDFCKFPPWLKCLNQSSQKLMDRHPHFTQFFKVFSVKTTSHW